MLLHPTRQPSGFIGFGSSSFRVAIGVLQELYIFRLDGSRRAMMEVLQRFTLRVHVPT